MKAKIETLKVEKFLQNTMFSTMQYIQQVKQHRNSAPVCFNISGKFVTRSFQLYIYATMKSS